MLRLAENITNIFIVCEYTDMRRSIDGLSPIIAQNYKLGPFSGDMFLFCGKHSDRLKALLWDGDGFLLLYKRLDNGSFKWPRNGNEARRIEKRAVCMAYARAIDRSAKSHTKSNKAKEYFITKTSMKD